MSSTEDIVGLLRDASQAYYSGEQLTMDNDTYDGIVERLRELDPTNSYFSEVGTLPSDTPVKDIICLTAQRDIWLEKKLVEKRLRHTTVLSANVTVIVVPDTPYKDHPKLLVARELGIKILTRSQFIQQYLS